MNEAHRIYQSALTTNVFQRNVINDLNVAKESH